MTCYVKIEDGVVIQKQPYAEDGFIEAPDWVSNGTIYDGFEFTNPVIPDPEIAPAVQILGPISAATLSISAGEVTGIETSVNFGAAFMIDTDMYWVFFTAPEPDTNYLVLGNCPFVRYTDYIEITAPDLAEISLTTWRVKEA